LGEYPYCVILLLIELTFDDSNSRRPVNCHELQLVDQKSERESFGLQPNSSLYCCGDKSPPVFVILFFLLPDLKVGAIHTPMLHALFSTNRTDVDSQWAAASETKRFSQYFRKMLELGTYLVPSQFEAGYVSIAHT
jgi:hypothetical protein